MFGGTTIRLGRVAGIEIGAHWSWFFIFFLMAWSLATTVFEDAGLGPSARWLAGAATSAIFFGSVLVHELSHSLTARRLGLPVNSITLFIFGGASNLEKEPTSSRQEFLMSIVGPLTSLALAIIFLVIWLTIGRVSDVVAVSTEWLAIINFMLFVFNMLPGFPLDGGRVLRAAIWWRNGNHLRATKIASRVGVGLAWLLIAGGVIMLFTGIFVSGL